MGWMSAEATAARHGSLHPSDDGGRGDGDDGGIVEVGRFVVDRRVAGPGRSLLAKSPPTCTADRAGPVQPVLTGVDGAGLRPATGRVARQRPGDGVRRAANRRLQDRRWTRIRSGPAPAFLRNSDLLRRFPLCRAY